MQKFDAEAMLDLIDGSASRTSASCRRLLIAAARPTLRRATLRALNASFVRNRRDADWRSENGSTSSARPGCRRLWRIGRRRHVVHPRANGCAIRAASENW